MAMRPSGLVIFISHHIQRPDLTQKDRRDDEEIDRDRLQTESRP